MENYFDALIQRPRRNRRSAAIRRLVCETTLSPGSLILPIFVAEGRNRRSAIASMPDVFRLTRDLAVKEARQAYKLGISAVALFPVIPPARKNEVATESLNPKGLLSTTIKAIKNAVPELAVITDVAMDPYSSDGHDGFVERGKVVNDRSVEILCGMALAQAEAGADVVAPSDMMDGRVGAIRRVLDGSGFSETGILAYSAKYCSAFYGPFRDALDSAPRHGDKKTYQMDPANRREAIREVLLDVEEGADIVMVKPALPYLDVVAEVRAAVTVPVAAYQVSGEYAMIKAAARNRWLDERAAVLESLTAIRRAGADMILTYAAKQAAEWLS
ncbi:MAG TPA: porphobilinogen synthase [Kiritimatiellia bacterium]|nr:porphobilinogen synthase [Kiritimatiellia bacterium]HMO99433.1 porphobilinogen synthase [Kiritimatiellia bacterium]HMP97740.1 porphobilinogen synthase [Kiritimatiellia bacterium]